MGIQLLLCANSFSAYFFFPTVLGNLGEKNQVYQALNLIAL